MADYITPEQAKALQDQYNQALADADNLNQQYQNNMNGNTQTTTTGNPTQSEMDAMKDLYPNLQYPSDYNNTNTTQTPPNTTTNNDPWSWNNTPSTTTTTTTDQTNGTTRDQALAEFSQISQRMQDGTATPADYTRAQELLNIINGNTQPTTDTTQPPSPTNTTTTTTPGSPTTTDSSTPSVSDAWAEWSAIMARVNAGTATPADYYRAQELLAIINGNTATPGSTNPGSGTPGIGTPGTGTGDTSSLFHEYPTVNPDREQAIRDMYDAQINAERAALQEQGDQALSDAQANRDNIAALYDKQRNAASVDWERQRRNFLEGANSSGLNTGAGSQAELYMMGMYQRSQTALGGAQAQAEAEAERTIADIRRSTQASINEAIMKNDYQKAAALLDEYNEQYNRAMERAEALAKYGDFSGYASLYGSDAAAQMRQTWIMSNPAVALAMGLISQSQYAQLTLYSKYPALAMAGLSGFSGGSGGGYSGGGGETVTPTGNGSYNFGELMDAAAAGYSKAQIEQALAARGVDTSDAAVQADIAKALSK